jgi:hypothetical protein
VFFGNKTRLYSDGLLHDDGGGDRVTVDDTQVAMGGGSGIGIEGVRGLNLRRNHVRSFALAPFVATINVRTSTVLERCGNVVEAGAGHPAIVEAPCP